MKRKKDVKLLDIRATESVKLSWKINRQIQQKLLEEKLVQCLLKPREGEVCIEHYPIAMQPMIRDFMQKADEQTGLFQTERANRK